MNNIQRITILVGTALIVLMLLFPPWLYFVGGQGVYIEKKVGYEFVLLPPNSPPSHEWVTKLDVQILVINIAVVVVATAGICLGFGGNRKRNNIKGN
jgi:hypothetical protein